ncbi:hypothetical protein LX15_000191 [Streptoalloteichus tenebrarius]|uniref:Bacterial Pleckstrin homology domain-containing protein n=1 Tax=Streptoalloteichus tenebrarius (strain ATCC 17920 / DSM 40477 / JCM 4838 / CBS 697.72 / NBRC 16177 / NCIMB 11028 / NRRL B-12390 / A12253. 1 / ISP 5477) TaxID=1933 RepID=A0ABT1HLX2_STRSD|nr:hypothetical protein [Streptoalloteichus tenebrarius]MCP2256508.1 hypothetical protein [Streptoalloteichus tenebrarius]
MEYRTTVRPPRWATVVFAVMFLAGVALSVFLWATRSEEVVACVVSTVLLVGCFGAILFCHGRITVDDRAVRLVLVPFVRRTVALRDVESVELSQTDAMREFGGWGYRFAGGGKVGFVLGSGPAVRMTTRNGRTYVISEPHADQLLTALRANMDPGRREVNHD